jgi:hypothetical protein
MKYMYKSSSVLFDSFLILIMLTGLIMMGSPFVSASVSKPSVPQFTVKLVDSSYWIPPSTSVDPYTGQTVPHPASYIDNRTLEFTIKNQPFTSYNDANSGFNITLFYNIRMRGHFGGNWTELFYVDGYHPVQSTSDYTVVSVPLGTHSDTLLQWLSPNSSSQLDFQVEAMIGYFSRTVGFASWYFAGEESGWSNTQTITIDAAPSGLPSQNPSLTSNQSGTPIVVLFGLGWWQVATIALSLVVVLLVFVVFYLRKRAVNAKSLPV